MTAFHKQQQRLQQGKQLTKIQIQQMLPPLPWNSMQWRPLLPKEGGLIQVDIGGHPPIPLARKTVFHLGSFSTVFWVTKFRGRFEALNDVFWGFGEQAIRKDPSLDQLKIFLLG
jgi:hypothetical protein